MNATFKRGLGNRIGPDIVDPLLSDKNAARAKVTAEINENDSSRKIINGGGPKNFFMYPTKLTQVVSIRSQYAGILKLYSRSYNKTEDGEYTINSAMQIEANVPDTRPD